MDKKIYGATIDPDGAKCCTETERPRNEGVVAKTLEDVLHFEGKVPDHYLWLSIYRVKQ